MWEDVFAKDKYGNTVFEYSVHEVGSKKFKILQEGEFYVVKMVDLTPSLKPYRIFRRCLPFTWSPSLDVTKKMVNSVLNMFSKEIEGTHDITEIPT